MSFDFVKMCELLEERKKVVSETGRPIVTAVQDPEPRNNDGRKHCWWCWRWTEKRQGFTAAYDVCPKCEK